jgi:hypothetical protein
MMMMSEYWKGYDVIGLVLKRLWQWRVSTEKAMMMMGQYWKGYDVVRSVLKRVWWWWVSTEKAMTMMSQYWKGYDVVWSVLFFTESRNTWWRTSKHIAHTQWLANNRSLGRQGGWERNWCWVTMIFRQMIQIEITNRQPTQTHHYANAK